MVAAVVAARPSHYCRFFDWRMSTIEKLMGIHAETKFGKEIGKK